MNVLFKIIWIYLILLPFAGVHTVLAWAEPSAVIFDTDISSDVDDVGAVAVLHSLAEEGKVRILAMIASSGDPWSVPCLRALNLWYGKGDIPVGQVKGESVVHASTYTEAVAREYGTKDTLNAKIPDAVSLYRKILSQQPDRSVTITTVGFLTNVANLLSSTADQYSQLSGHDLVNKKVKRLVLMGGEYPKGKEWNFVQDVSSTKYVAEHWPTTMDFVGVEVGTPVLTGETLKNLPDCPIKRAFQLHQYVDENFERPSWDQVTVLAATMSTAHDHGQIFTFHSGQTNHIFPDGLNIWKPQQGSNHRYVMPVISPKALEGIIEIRMSSAAGHVQ